jgi:UDP-3-O-[3-hydroxymyristoyl] glucosamine N-acyltransferase
MAPQRSFSLAELARRFDDLQLKGDGAHELEGIGTLASATSRDLTFLANPAYRDQLAETRAGAVILTADDADRCPVNCLVAKDPYLAFARVACLFDRRPVQEAGVHASAVVDETAEIGEGVSIGPSAVVGAGSRIGPRSVIGPGCVVAADVHVGADCRISVNVTLMDGVRLGERVIVHPGAVIGADGFGLAFAGDHWEKVSQLGSVVIGDDCEIGANTTIDRGAIGDTVLEEDVRIDNLVQVAHNVRIGAHTAIAASSGIAGSTHIGRYVLVGGQSGIAGHLEIADRVTVSAKSAVMKSITEPGATWSSTVPARPIRTWQRSIAQLNRLDRLAAKVRELERKNRTSEENE